MNIHFITDVITNQPTAPAHHVLEKCGAFARHGHEVTLVHAVRRLLPAREHAGALRDVALPCPPMRGGRWLFDHLLARHVKNAAAPGGADVFYFRYAPTAGIIAALTTVKIPKVFELNGLEVCDWPLFAEFVDAMDLVMVPSEELKAICCASSRIAEDKVIVHVSPATDSELFRPLPRDDCRRELGLPMEKKLLLLVSSFQWHHDFETAAAALRLLNGDGSDYQLMLLGDGPDRPKFEEMLRDQLESGEVTMPGSVPKDRLPTYIGAADACLSLGRAAVLVDGNLRAFKILEYAACARPSVVTVDFSLPVADWAKDIYALVPPESPEAVARAVEDIVAEPAKWAARSAHGREYMREHRSWDTVVKTTLSSLEHLVHGADA